MATSGARPSALRAFTTTAASIDTDSLAPRGEPLRTALDAFRSTAGWPDWLSDVPPLDIDFGAMRGRLAQIADFVDQVAAGFEAVDTDPNRDDQVTMDDSALADHVRIDLDAPVTLVQDGSRWIFPGSADPDYVRVVTENGRTFIEVGTVTVVNGRRELRWTRQQLSDDQARNLVIRTGGGNDFIGVSPDVQVTITVWSGDGHDAIGMPGQNVSSRLGGSGADRIFAGTGNDRVEGGAGDDQIYGGDGNDYIDGQRGHDRIVGGGNEDTIYGGQDSDSIDGGAGDDYLEGGSGADNLRGGNGRDILSGGRDNDALHGGAGDDDLFGGRGVDVVQGGMGNDKVTADSSDTVTGHETRVTIELTGDPGTTGIDFGSKPDWMTDAEWDAWNERLDSDIEFLRTTQSGRAGLEALDQASRDSNAWWNPFDGNDQVRILPYQPWHGGDPQPNSFDEYVDAMLNGENLPGEDAGHAGHPDSLVRFDRSYQGGDLVSYGHANQADFSFGPPSLTLQHELSHAYDHLHGGVEDGDESYTEILRDANGNEIRRSEVPRAELNSQGLDTDGDGDPDTIDTDDGTDHPDAFTENALRAELRKPRRDSYTMGTQDGRRNGEHVTYENAT
jgi:Effector protein/RTX calcium-binding nonapeptide repeat (4 copies)